MTAFFNHSHRSKKPQRFNNKTPTNVSYCKKRKCVLRRYINQKREQHTNESLRFCCCAAPSKFLLVRRGRKTSNICHRSQLNIAPPSARLSHRRIYAREEPGSLIKACNPDPNLYQVHNNICHFFFVNLKYLLAFAAFLAKRAIFHYIQNTHEKPRTNPKRSAYFLSPPRCSSDCERGGGPRRSPK